MKEKIVKMLNEVRPEFDFSEVHDFIENGMLDSFDVITLVTSLDEEFGISIEGIDILPENFGTIDAIMRLLSKYSIQ